MIDVSISIGNITEPACKRKLYDKKEACDLLFCFLVETDLILKIKKHQSKQDQLVFCVLVIFKVC